MRKSGKIFWSMMVIILAGCAGHTLSRGSAFQLQPVAFSALPGWNDDDLRQAVPAMIRGCKKPTAVWQKFCQNVTALEFESTSTIRAYLEKNLIAYRVTSNGKKTGKITGYYEAELTGTRTKTRANQVPVYGVPTDKNRTRASIESRGCNAPIIAWADCAADLFVLHIQGSGRMMTPDGEIRLSYAGNNNETFVPLSKIFDAEHVTCARSMPTMKQWLKDHPDEGRRLMAKNPRYIYFSENTGDTPIGSAGVVLTPQRSIAVDRSYVPMNTPVWLVTNDPDGAAIKRLVMAQDTGAAINGPLRVDYFWGHGAMEFAKAGRMNSQGEMYILWPREDK